jgi:hypothetical protein
MRQTQVGNGLDPLAVQLGGCIEGYGLDPDEARKQDPGVLKLDILKTGFNPRRIALGA